MAGFVNTVYTYISISQILFRVSLFGFGSGVNNVLALVTK